MTFGEKLNEMLQAIFTKAAKKDEIPTKVSQLTNDSGYLSSISRSQLPTATKLAKGGIIVGDGLNVDSTGKVDVAAADYIVEETITEYSHIIKWASGVMEIYGYTSQSITPYTNTSGGSTYDPTYLGFYWDRTFTQLGMTSVLYASLTGMVGTGTMIFGGFTAVNNNVRFYFRASGTNQAYTCWK